MSGEPRDYDRVDPYLYADMIRNLFEEIGMPRLEATNHDDRTKVWLTDREIEDLRRSRSRRWHRSTSSGPTTASTSGSAFLEGRIPAVARGNLAMPTFRSVSSHDLRRRFAQRLLVDEAMNPRVVIQVGGWNSFQAIETYLNAPSPEVVNAAFGAVDM